MANARSEVTTSTVRFPLAVFRHAWAILVYCRFPGALSRQRAETGRWRPVVLRNALRTARIYGRRLRRRCTRKLDSRWEERIVRTAGMGERCFFAEVR